MTACDQAATTIALHPVKEALVRASPPNNMASAETSMEPGAPLPLQGGWPTHIFTLSIVMPILATLAVAGRLVAKRKTRARFRLDDALIVSALVRKDTRP